MALKLADFESIKDLGSGSFGSVKLVRKKDDSQVLAMKTVSLTRLTQKEKDNALNEIRLLASIQIPYVIAYKGCFFDQQTSSLCILMQYADGGDLQSKVEDLRSQQRKYGFQQKYIWKVAYQVLQGLKMLHINKIIHRDIKSANIFFVNGIAKLGDMNVSKVAEQGLCQTQTGTPYYTSPQIWSGKRYGNKCDIWSLGVLLYQMCALTMPFKARDFPSLYKKVMQGKYDQIHENYSDELRNLIRMCLIVQDQMRPSASQLLETAILSGMQMSLQSFNAEQGQIKLIDPIKCPKVLRFLAVKLPKNRFEQDKKPQSSFKIKSIKKIKSQKNIHFQVLEENKSVLFNPKVIESKRSVSRTPSRKNIKIPPEEQQSRHQSRKHIQIIEQEEPKNGRVQKESSKKSIKLPRLQNQTRACLPPILQNQEQKRSLKQISSSRKLVINSSKNISFQKQN